MSIEHARNLPLSKVNIDDAHLPEHKHKKLVIHCQAGKRSMMACEKLADAPFDVWNLEGGILAWKDAGLPVKSSTSKHMPLDRQVQLTIGLATFIGVALGYFISPAWLVLPTVTGLGLINAGLTGWCGLATIVAMMPWNQK
ncbi:UNVERIFIED_CONTAM: hypothetical protein GTU68_067130 [Idotea baltica]|nr:hypothetical protein [Idotea baltica]